MFRYTLITLFVVSSVYTLFAPYRWHKNVRGYFESLYIWLDDRQLQDIVFDSVTSFYNSVTFILGSAWWSGRRCMLLLCVTTLYSGFFLYYQMQETDRQSFSVPYLDQHSYDKCNPQSLEYIEGFCDAYNKCLDDMSVDETSVRKTWKGHQKVWILSSAVSLFIGFYLSTTITIQLIYNTIQKRTASRFLRNATIDFTASILLICISGVIFNYCLAAIASIVTISSSITEDKELSIVCEDVRMIIANDNSFDYLLSPYLIIMAPVTVIKTMIEIMNGRIRAIDLFAALVTWNAFFSTIVNVFHIVFALFASVIWVIRDILRTIALWVADHHKAPVAILEIMAAILLALEPLLHK